MLDLTPELLRQIPCKSARFESGYRFLVNPHKEHMLKVQRFRDWMVAEMREMESTLDRR